MLTALGGLSGRHGAVEDAVTVFGNKDVDFAGARRPSPPILPVFFLFVPALVETHEATTIARGRTSGHDCDASKGPDRGEARRIRLPIRLRSSTIRADHNAWRWIVRRIHFGLISDADVDDITRTGLVSQKHQQRILVTIHREIEPNGAAVLFLRILGRGCVRHRQSPAITEVKFRP